MSDENTSKNSENITRLVKQDNDYYIKVPHELVEQHHFKEADFVEYNIKPTQNYIVELPDVVIDEIHRFKENPQYKDLDDGEVLKMIMFKFHHKDEQDKIKAPSKKIKIVKKGTYD